MESGKAGMSQSGKKDPIKIMKKREDEYKRLISKMTIANDVLKKLESQTLAVQKPMRVVIETCWHIGKRELPISEY